MPTPETATAQITTNGAGDIDFTGVISNSTGVVKSDAGTVTLSGDNTYAGVTQVAGGLLAIAHDNGLGGSADGTTVALGAQLGLSGNINVPETLKLAPSSLTSISLMLAFWIIE